MEVPRRNKERAVAVAIAEDNPGATKNRTSRQERRTGSLRCSPAWRTNSLVVVGR